MVVICGEPQLYDERRDILTNPTVVFEVLSPSTEACYTASYVLLCEMPSVCERAAPHAVKRKGSVGPHLRPRVKLSSTVLTSFEFL